MEFAAQNVFDLWQSRSTFEDGQIELCLLRRGNYIMWTYQGFSLGGGSGQSQCSSEHQEHGGEVELHIEDWTGWIERWLRRYSPKILPTKDSLYPPAEDSDTDSDFPAPTSAARGLVYRADKYSIEPMDLNVSIVECPGGQRTSHADRIAALVDPNSRRGQPRPGM